MQLAQMRPLSKITVRDIVEACGITRNTFYYHFHDIYEVLEDVIDAKFESLSGMWGKDPRGCAKELQGFCEEHRKILLNFYKTVGHDVIEKYLRQQMHAILMETLAAENVSYGVEEEDLLLIAAFHEEALTGLLLRFLKDEKETVSVSTLRWEEFFTASVQACLACCSKRVEKNVNL